MREKENQVRVGDFAIADQQLGQSAVSHPEDMNSADQQRLGFLASDDGITTARDEEFQGAIFSWLALSTDFEPIVIRLGRLGARSKANWISHH